jgi:hypothetical protein
MPRRWLRVVKAAALAAVILGGGGGMPVLDVILYHGLAPSRSSEPHFEPSGAHCHGELCKLDSRFPYSTQAESLDLRIPLVTTPFRELALAPLAPRPANPELLPRPRAPPGLTA